MGDVRVGVVLGGGCPGGGCPGGGWHNINRNDSSSLMSSMIDHLGPMGL